ncbi:hypothetical protein [Pseudoroseicyclus sp. CXY001]|uniref:hypothetical protein n=1 Tax=Pseudoroseicyclus sp. CXY001 TaxID=3242492 RepID=UPI00357175A8
MSGGDTAAGPTPGIGHNGGPSMEPGFGWRRHAWARARAELMPHLPLEVVRRRVARAKDLGLPYRTYAGIRASTGRDVIGFLFSTNALRMLRAGALPPPEVAERLGAIRGAARIGLARPPVAQEALAALMDAAHPAPRPFAPWAEARAGVTAALEGRPGDAVVLVGDTAEERLWAEAGRLAHYLGAEAYFGAGA